MPLFIEDNLRHHRPIKHIISMFEEKIAKNFEEIVILMGNLPIFASLFLHITLFIYVSRHDCVFNIAGF